MENLANTKSWVTKNLATMESRITENLADMESRVTESLANTEKRVMQDSGGGGVRNQKKENVLLQAKGQLHGGGQEVLPRHKNADCKRCVEENWPRRKKRKSGTIGLPFIAHD
jgi:hypothetical protein